MEITIESFLANVADEHRLYFKERLEFEAIYGNINALTEYEVAAVVGPKLGHKKAWQMAIEKCKALASNSEFDCSLQVHPFTLFEASFLELTQTFSPDLVLELQEEGILNCVDELLNAIALWAALMLIEFNLVETDRNASDKKHNSNYSYLVMVLNCRYKWLFKHDKIMVIFEI